MNENKSKNLLFLLLLVALVIIAIMGSYIFNLNNTIDDLTPPESALSKEEAETKAKTILETFVNLADYTTTDFSPMPNLLAELGLETRDNISALCNEQKDHTAYIKSNTSYETFKNEMLKYMTEKYFMDNYSGYINVDGNVGFKNVGIGLVKVSVDKVELFGFNDNEYIFNVTYIDDQIYDNAMLDGVIDENEKNYTFTGKVTFVLENDKFVVSEY